MHNSVPVPISVTVNATPSGDVLADSPVNLTCIIELSESVDVAVTVNTIWTGPPGREFISATSTATSVSQTTYTSTAAVRTGDSGEYMYTCTAIVSSTSSFIIASRDVSEAVIVTVSAGMYYSVLILVAIMFYP